jgi:DNA polymerase III alpha subunit
VISYQTVLKLKKGYSSMKFEKVVSVKYIEPRQTMDIEVDSADHIFYGNGIATSNSHAVAYAINSFASAYCKAHDPIKFYTVYLNNASSKPDKQREIKELIMDAKLQGIEVLPPRLDFFYRRFTMDRAKNVIYFGYSDVKNVGEGEQETLARVVQEAEDITGKSIKEFNWLECLFLIGNEIKKNAFISIISVGGLTGKNNKLNRNRMIFEFDIWNKLTIKEQGWIISHWKSSRMSNSPFIDLVNLMINNNEKINSRRITAVLDIYQALQNPPYSLEDDYVWIADIEQKLMGCSLTCSQSDNLALDDVNITCKEIANGEVKKMQDAKLAVKVNQVREYKLKRGQHEGEFMAFVIAEDSSGELDSITVFSEEFSQYKKLLFEGNTVLLYGEVQEKKDKSFVVKKVLQI